MSPIDLSIAFITAVPATVAAWASISTRAKTKENTEVTRENGNVARRIEKQTNGELERKIRSAVMEVFKDHRGQVTEAVMAESVRHLLNAIINDQQRPES